ncbi:hypothetical protein L211DRAFT_558386 [Terfezia boudieri ATCC MYA-4762]|uniref:Uncharacterized protein n=1 Tax=Terfezia boudieri ATCC MYA-4762 TaxID=1051890 RepID=A0A3N4LXM1_9PEZI|nr:hypothetical protein L211DRAFT_558386 [Terfezia boudieri ATCC MYA-4762]
MFIRPNQEKVFYALLERYKDDSAKYHLEGKLFSQPNAFKRLPSNKSGKSLRSKTGSTRSGAQNRASNKRTESGKYISLQRLHQIQESEESQGTCVNTTGRAISEESEDKTWQDYHCAFKDIPEVKYKSNSMTEDHHVFHDFVASEPEDEVPSPKEPPQRDQQRKKSRPKSWVSVAPHRRSVVFNHKGSSRTDRFDIEQIADSFNQDSLPTRASTPDSSPERILMGRKEGMKARGRKRSSIGSSYSGAVTGIATVIPVRRRAIMRTEGGDVRRRSILPMEDEDVRKVSREFSDICEAAFRTSSTILPRTLPSSAVFDETVVDLELSRLTFIPGNNTAPIAQESLHKDEGLHLKYPYVSDFDVPIRTLEKGSDLGAVIADLDEQIMRFGSKAVNNTHPVKHKWRAVSDSIQCAGSEREERRAASAPTHPTQGQNRGHRAVAQNSQFNKDASIPNTRNFSVRTETGVLDLPYISPRGRPLDKGTKASGKHPESTYSDTDRENHRTNCSSSLYVERHRQEVTRLGGFKNGYSPAEEDHNGNGASDTNIPKKRTIFSKLFDTKFGTARAPELLSSKVKTSGFWSTIGSKIGATAAKPTQECQPVSGSKFFRLWNREYKKEMGNGELHSVVVQNNQC